MRKTATLVVGSHGFTIKDYNGEFYEKLRRYCARFVECRIEPTVVNGRQVLTRVPDRVFGASTKDRSETRLHINCLNEFKQFMQSNGYNPGRFKIINAPITEGVDVKFEFLNESITPREHQVEWIDYQLNREPTGVTTRVNNLQTGKGKAVSLETPVRVPGGWKPMGEIKVGDYVVAWDGSYTQVTAVYPQPLKQLYTVAFGDGRNVEVCGEHLWEITHTDADGVSRCDVVNTHEVKRLLTVPDTKTTIRLIIPEDVEPQVLRTSPYTIGLRAGTNVCPYGIPQEYLTASVSQKEDLIRGMFDSRRAVVVDGGNAVTYTTRTYVVARQLTDVVRSLGGIAKITQHAFAYSVKVELSNLSRFFTRSDKKSLCIDRDDLKLTVVSVIPTRVGLSQCISVDHPDKLFVIKDYIVTHNTFCAIYNLVKLGKRTVILLMPKYIDTWLVGLSDFVKLTPKDVMIIKGADELNAAMHLGEKDELEAKIIIISLPTYQYFMSEYEDNNGVMQHYDYVPDQFCDVMKPGFLIVDEGHESIHALFKFDLYARVKNKLVLSATLEHDDPFINEMYKLIYPLRIRFNGGAYDKYIESIALFYGMNRDCKIKYKGFGGTYSHVRFEQSILKSKKLLMAYMNFIANAVDYFFIRVREPEQKVLVYCATVAMCLQVSVFLTEKYKKINFDVRKFTQGDPKECLHGGDGTVTTLMSAGTGVDVQGARTVIMTVAIGSSQKAAQALGRLRRLKKYPDTTPTYVYMCCTGIKQHMQYHRRRLSDFENKTLSQRVMNSGFSL